MTNDRESELWFRTKVLAVVGTLLATIISILVFIPQISLAARVHMTAELWFFDLWGFMVGLVGGGSLCHFLMGSRIYAYGRIDSRTMWEPKSRLGVAAQITIFLVIPIGIGFFMANAFLEGMHPKPLP
jgi:hypothetical protein